jgi:hypothetical protein
MMISHSPPLWGLLWHFSDVERNNPHIRFVPQEDIFNFPLIHRFEARSATAAKKTMPRGSCGCILSWRGFVAEQTPFKLNHEFGKRTRQISQKPRK